MGIHILVAALFTFLMAVLYVTLYNVSDPWPSSVRRSLRVGFAALVVAGLLGCAFLYTTTYAIDAPTLERGRERSDTLLTALEQYKASEGLYPPDLDALVPAHLAEMPRPAWRCAYAYRRCASGKGYVLAFKAARIPDGSCAYSSTSREWKCSDDLPRNWRESCSW
jgi:hypothetical protein